MVVEIVGNGDVLQAAQFVGDILFALDVTAILDLNLCLLDLFGCGAFAFDVASELRKMVGKSLNRHIIAQNEVKKLATLR